MKIKLLNSGCYATLNDVKFPIEVEGFIGDAWINIKNSELCRISNEWASDHAKRSADELWPFMLHIECEIIEE